MAAIIMAVAALGVGVAVGKYALPSQAATKAPGNAAAYAGGAGRMGQFGAGRTVGSAAGMGFVSGEVVKKDDTSLSVKLRDGSMKLVVITPSTKASKMADASMADIAVGQQVMVTGSTNSDGSVTAQTVQLRPENLPMGGPGGRVNGQPGSQPNAQPQTPPTGVGN